MTYRPREFWEERLAGQFDLRGTGETTMSAGYNAAVYALRRDVLTSALAAAGADPRGRSVLDVGCGTGFWTAYYLSRGAAYTGLDIAETSVVRLRERWPQATFVRADVSEADLPGRYDFVNVFDVLYHITDDARWADAVRRLGEATRPGGLLLITDAFAATRAPAEHNTMRSLELYRDVLSRVGGGFETLALRSTHVLLGFDLGRWRRVNRFPQLLLAADRVLLALGAGNDERHNRLWVARRKA